MFNEIFMLLHKPHSYNNIEIQKKWIIKSRQIRPKR